MQQQKVRRFALRNGMLYNIMCYKEPAREVSGVLSCMLTGDKVGKVARPWYSDIQPRTQIVTESA